MTESRTRRSLRNGAYSASLFIVNIILSFVARGVFVRHVGVDLLGLNTSVENLLGLLSLAELGVSYAIVSSLYAPMSCGDYAKVAEVVALQGWIYRRVALFIIAGSAVLMAFFPVIFADADFPLWYAYAAYVAYLFSALLGYFVNYKMVVIDVCQESYKVTLATRVPNAVRTVLQIIALAFTSYGYEIWLVLNIICAIVSSAILSHIVWRDHTYLSQPVAGGRVLLSKYPEVGTKVRQLMVQRISAIAFQRSSPVILLAFSSLAEVGIYGNYMLIFSGVSMLVESAFNGMNASVGNLVNSSPRRHILDVFHEILTMRIVVGAVCAFGFYFCTPAFVDLWVGRELRLDSLATLLLSLTLFVDISRAAVDSFLNSKGYFSDIFAPVAEAGLNIGLSVALGSVWGLHGILTGVLISLLVVIVWWKPYFLFRIKMRVGYGEFLRAYWWSVAMAAVLAVCFFFSCAFPECGSPFANLAFNICLSVLFFSILSAILAFSSLGGRRLVERVRRLVSNRAKPLSNQL